jgi:hypothetical protein
LFDDTLCRKRRRRSRENLSKYLKTDCLFCHFRLSETNECFL